MAGRVKKNERFAKTLDVLGYGEVAAKIREDKSILQPEDFNAAKTWTEYINRLVGAVTGIFLLACVFFAFPYLRVKKRIFLFSLLNVFLVGFQAWLGSIVVSTNLLAWVVTVHMLLAIAIVAVTIYTLVVAQTLGIAEQPVRKRPVLVQAVLSLALLLTIGQIVLGTEVREGVDQLAAQFPLLRASWLDRLGSLFSVHRDLALVVVVLNGAVFMLIKSGYTARSLPFRYGGYTLAIVGLQVITGIILSYAHLPGYAQCIHLVLAILLFSAQFYNLLMLSKSQRLQLS